MRTVPFEVVQIDYQWTNEQIKLLTDIRFRLIAIASPLVGVAVTLLSTQTLGTTAAAPAQTGTAAVLTAAVGIFGFIVTLGVVLYDLRNSQLYNALVHRAKVLEGILGCAGSGEETMTKPPSAGQANLQDARMAVREPDPPRPFAAQGGLHTQRAKRYGTFLGQEISHGSGLSMIYAALLSSWMFPISKSAGLLGANVAQPYFLQTWPERPVVALLTSGIAVAVSIVAFFWFRSLHSQKDPGAVATLLGYRDRDASPWEKRYELAVAQYDHPDAKRRRREKVKESREELAKLVLPARASATPPTR